MPARNARCCPVLALALAVLFAPGGRAAQNTESSTLADQKDLAVTVYNSNIALVRDVRRMRLPTGAVDLRGGGNEPIHCLDWPTARLVPCHQSPPFIRDGAVDQCDPPLESLREFAAQRRV